MLSLIQTKKMSKIKLKSDDYVTTVDESVLRVIQKGRTRGRQQHVASGIAASYANGSWLTEQRDKGVHRLNFKL
jgi:hypothetical protein